MAQNLDLNVNVNTDQAAKSVSSLKTQLKQAQAEVVALSDKFGATSVEAVNAAKKAAELRDRIGDARALTEAFNPDQKFKALTQSLSGVAGGFAAVQGAMSLFGSESEDLQKTLVKVQSAMALSQGLEAVGNSIDSFKNLGAVIKNQVISSFSTLRGAIIATGLGALAIGVGLLIANFDKVKETLTNLFPGLIEFGNQVKNIVQQITDFVGITSKAARAQDDLKLALETSNKSIDNQIKILEAQGGKEDEIYNQKRERINNQIKLIKGSSQEELQARADLYTELKVLDINEANRIKKANEDSAKERTDKIKKEQEKEKEAADKLQKNLLKSYEDYLKRREFARKNSEGLYKEDIQKFEEQEAEEKDKKRNEEIDKNVIAQNIALAKIKLNGVQILEIDQANADARAKIREEQRESELKADQELQEAKYQIAQVGLGLLASLAGENERLANIIFAISKALEIGKIISSTAASIAQVNTGVAAVPAILPPSLPNPAFPTAVAIGAKKIASLKIGAVASIATIAAASIAKFKSGGGGGGEATQGGGTISSEAPIIPQLPAAQTTNISRQSINDLGNQAVRAYVIETDVTGNQQRMAAIRQRARFS